MPEVLDGTYQLKNHKCGGPLYPAGHADGDGDRAAWVNAQAGYGKEDGDSMWRFEYQGDGKYKIFSVKHGGPLCAASYPDRDGDRRACVKKRTGYNHDDNVVWTVKKQPDGTYKLINVRWGCVLSSSNLCDEDGHRKAWGKRSSTYDDRGNARWEIKRVPHKRKASAFLWSSGKHATTAESALRKVLKDFWAKARPNKKVNVVAFFDAKPGALSDLMKHSEMYQTVLKVARQVATEDYGGCLQVKGFGYRFGWKFKKAELSRCQKRCGIQGSIAVVVGGNTYALAHGMAKVPLVRDAIRTNVRQGSLLYTSFSAGTCFAGVTTQIAVDPLRNLKGKKIKMIKNGLGICDLIFRPHSGAAGHPQGSKLQKRMRDGTLTDDAGNQIKRPVVYLRDHPRDFYAVVHGELHHTSTILRPTVRPAPFLGM